MKGELYVLLEGQNRGMPEAAAFHPSLVPVHRSIKRCELYAEKQRMALRQKLAAICHTQLRASATKTAAARLCVKPRCKAFAFASVPRPMRKSKSGKLASNISKASCGRYWRHCEMSRAFNCDARTRKLQNPAKLCAIGEATGCNLSCFHLSGRRGFNLRAGGFWRDAKKPIVNALNLPAYLPPIELGNYGRSRVGS